MRFARTRATAGDSSDEPAPAPYAQPSADDLAPIQLLLADAGLSVGWLATGGQRTSDWLNARREGVPIHGLRPGDEIPATGSPSGPPEELEPGRIVWVVPLPLPPNRHLRLHRRRILVNMKLDEYEVSGQVHVRPGADAVDQVLRGTRNLVPLTEVEIAPIANPDAALSVPVLIVNRAHVRHVLESTPRRAAAQPDPIDLVPDTGPIDPRLALLLPQSSEFEVDAPRWPDAAAGAPELGAATEVEPNVPSGIEMLNAALELLLETGVLEVAEFQSIRARIPSPRA